MSVRTLPLRVTPLPGEALDSWLEALARCHEVPFGDLLHHVGLARRAGWLVVLHESEVLDLTTATGVAAELLQAMTLEHFNGIALEVDSIKRRVARGYGWKSRRLSRFCPSCLVETGGRWQLAWRLRWSFACTTHRCILADNCAACRCLTRTEVHASADIPQPGLCAQRCRDENYQPAQKCGANLEAREVIHLPEGHPILEAQGLVSALIRDNVATFGIYASKPCSARTALEDVKFIGEQVLSRSISPSFARTLPALLQTVYLEANERVARFEPYAGLGVAVNSPLTTAVAVTVATAVLQGRDVDRVGEHLRLTLPSGTSGDCRSARP